MVDVADSLTTLQMLGVDSPEYVASGMEGNLFRVGDEMVAKVWFSKPLSDVAALESFYASLQALRLPFATPQILGVHSVGGTTVSLERELPGRPMKGFIDDADERAPPFAVDALSLVLTQLAERRATAGAPRLPLLGVPVVQERGDQGASTALLRVAETKVARFGGQLRAAVPRFDQLFARVVEHLGNLSPPAACPIHGDVFPENILLDEARRVSAVLDWGFFSLHGDPALEASITAGIFNMYGSHHRAIDDQLLDLFARAFGHPRERMLLYRALYAIITSNAFSADGADGHFAWCVEQLRREDVRSALAAAHVP